MRDETTLQIRDLKDGEIITEPGFYRLPMARHHGQPCCAPDRLKEIMKGDKPKPGEWAVTSSVLRKMELETPADHYAFSLLNPNRWPDEERPALRLGRAMACLVEGGPEELEKHFRVLPSNKPRKPTAAQETAYANGSATEAGIKSVEFWAKVEADPRDILTETEWAMLCDMGKVLANDPAAQAALGGEPEITMAWYDEDTDLWCLARPDLVAFGGFMSDFKKVNMQGRPFNYRTVDRKITDYGYHMQMAFAAEAFERITGNHPDSIGLVFQTDKPPHHVILRALDEETIRIGMFQNIRARSLFRHCLDTGHWPGPGEDIGAYQMPKWFYERMIDEMNTAGIAA